MLKSPSRVQSVTCCQTDAVQKRMDDAIAKKIKREKEEQAKE